MCQKPSRLWLSGEFWECLLVIKAQENLAFGASARCITHETGGPSLLVGSVVKSSEIQGMLEVFPLASTVTRSCLCMLSSFVVSDSLEPVAHQAPLSMGFSRQEYWSGLPFPPPRDLPDPGIKLASLMSPALAGRFFAIHATWEVLDGV